MRTETSMGMVRCQVSGVGYEMRDGVWDACDDGKMRYDGMRLRGEHGVDVEVGKSRWDGMGMVGV